MSEAESSIRPPVLPENIRHEFRGGMGIIHNLEQAVTDLDMAHSRMSLVLDCANGGNKDALSILIDYIRVTGELTKRLVIPDFFEA